MRVSLTMFLADSRHDGRSVVDAFVADVRSARSDGFTRAWVPQLPWEHDVLTTLAVAFREVDDIVLGTGVLPLQSRLPMVLAQEALTLNLIGGGRFRLGLGLTHELVSNGMWGVPWDRPVRRVNEYLDGLLPLLAGEEAHASGETATARGRVDVPGAAGPPVYLAALGPQLLGVAGRRAAGTITWMTGPRTLAEHVVPTISAAAAEAGRSAEVIAGFPVCVTDDPAGARQLAAETLGAYGALPSYRAMLDREGVAGPEQLAIVGDEDAVAEQLEALAQAGVDELIAHILRHSPADQERTRALLRDRAAAA